MELILSILNYAVMNCKLGWRAFPDLQRQGRFHEQLHTSRRMYAVGRLASPLWTVAVQCSRIAERLRRSHFAARPDAGLRAWAQTQCRSDPACLDGLGHVLAWVWFLLAGRAGAGLLEGDDGRPDADGRPRQHLVHRPADDRNFLWPAVSRPWYFDRSIGLLFCTFDPRHSGRLALCLRAKRKR